MSRKVNGNITIEAAIIVPILLGMFSVIILLLLYYHDKNVVIAVSHEVAIVGDEGDETEEAKIEALFQKQIEGRLFLFSAISAKANVDAKEIRIVCSASKNNMKLHTKIQMERTEPEKFVRKLLFMENIKDENILQK